MIEVHDEHQRNIAVTCLTATTKPQAHNHRWEKSERMKIKARTPSCEHDGLHAFSAVQREDRVTIETKRASEQNGEFVFFSTLPNELDLPAAAGQA